MKQKFAPTIVLGAICLIAALLLAAVNGITAPKIAQIQIEQANAARAEVMPEATGFDDVTADCNIDPSSGVTEVYKSTSDTGYVITSAAKGFGGNIVVMTAIKTDGSIEAIKVTDASNETPGLGARVTEASHAEKFVGKASITMDDKSAADYVAPISGASYSSKGVFNAVKAALDVYESIGGAN